MIIFHYFSKSSMYFICCSNLQKKKIRVSQKFCNILVVCANFRRVYYMTEAIQAVRGILYGW